MLLGNGWPQFPALVVLMNLNACPPQNVNLTYNCNCRGFSMVLGRPKVEFGDAGINRDFAGQAGAKLHVGSALVTGVGARLPPGTGMGPAGQAIDDDPAWMARVVASL